MDQPGTVIPLVTLAILMPTATILPFVLYCLRALRSIEDRLDSLEHRPTCPFKQ